MCQSPRRKTALSRNRQEAIVAGGWGRGSVPELGLKCPLTQEFGVHPKAKQMEPFTRLQELKGPVFTSWLWWGECLVRAP